MSDVQERVDYSSSDDEEIKNPDPPKHDEEAIKN